MIIDHMLSLADLNMLAKQGSFELFPFYVKFLTMRYNGNLVDTTLIAWFMGAI